MHCRLDDAAALESQIRESEAAHPVGLLGDVVVLRNGARAARINTPAIEQNALLRWTVKLEGGGERARRSARLGPARARLAPAGRQVVRAARPAAARGSAARLSPPRDRPRIRGPGMLPAHRHAGQVPRAARTSRRAPGSGAWPCSSTRCARTTTGASAISPTSPKCCGWPPRPARASSASARCTRCFRRIPRCIRRTRRRAGTR